MKGGVYRMLTMKLTFVLQALRMGFLPRSNSAKLLPGTGGKDVDSVI